MFRRSFLLTASILALVGHGVEGQLIGRCFDSEVGPWTPIPGTHVVSSSPRPAPDDGELFHAFPARLLISARPARRPAGWSRVEIPEGALPVPKPYRRWRFERDTLRISLSDGFTGVRAYLVEAGGVWRGRADQVTDEGGVQRYGRDIELIEADCRSTPPIRATSDPPLPREVPSGSGPSVRLGHPLPADYEVEAVRPDFPGGWLNGFVPGAYWAGAERVLVQLNEDSLVTRLELRYSEGFATERLLEGLIADFGPGRAEAPWPSWRNHSTRAFLQSGGSPRAVLIDRTLAR